MPYFSASDANTPPPAVPSRSDMPIAVTVTLSRRSEAEARAVWRDVASVAADAQDMGPGVAVLPGKLSVRSGPIARVDPDDENDIGLPGQVETQRLHVRLDELFFFSSRRRHTRSTRDWSSDVCSSD